MKTRIGIVAFGLHIGGMEQSMLRIARGLSEAGAEIEFITTEEIGPWHDHVSAQGFRVMHIDYHPLGGFFHVLRTGRFLRQADYDVLFLFHSQYVQAGLQMLSDRTVVIPAIRSDDSEFYRIGLANASAWNVALANSPRLRDEVLRLVPGKPVVYIPNGVEIPSNDRLESRIKHSTPLQLLFVGRLDRRKGVHFLPKIISECNRRKINLVCHIVGDGEERVALQNDIRAAGLSDKQVEFTGKVSSAEAYELMLNSHVLLLPTLVEGLPNVLLEAQACGCVPVASRIEGITDMTIESDRTGLLVPLGNVEAFVDGIEKLAGDASLWFRLSAAGPQRIRNMFSIAKLNKSCRKLIEDCMSGKYPLTQTRRHFFPVKISILRWRDLAPPFVKAAVRPLRRWIGQIPGKPPEES